MPTPANSINEATTGICGFTGTAFTSTPVTTHDVLIGGATSSTIAQAAPSATSGVPLISQGVSADPIFGTAVVAGGGTGDTSFTAYSVICAGTTSTGALQNVSGVGTSAQVLTSNGPGALPTWQTSSGFAPNSTVQLFDDFIGFNSGVVAGGELISMIAWNSSTSSFNTAATADSAHPGILSSTIVPSATQYLFARSDLGGSFVNSMVLGGGAITLNWVFKIATLSTGTNRYNLIFGMGDTTSAADQVNGCYIRYSDNVNSGNWQFVTASASTRTTSNSSIAADTSWHNFTLTINAGATSVSYAIDGVSLGTAITTNIPTAALSPCMLIQQAVGTVAAGSILIDLFYMTQTLTTPR